MRRAAGLRDSGRREGRNAFPPGSQFLRHGNVVHWCGGIGAAASVLLLANTDMFLAKPQKAALEYLEDTELKTLEKDAVTFKAKALWENGAVIVAVRRPG